MELGGLEPPTSWVRSSLTQRTKRRDLQAVLQFPGRLTARSCVSVCRGFVGSWSALTVARTSVSSSEPGRSGEVSLKG